MKYEQRMVTFPDILVFRSLLDEAIDKDGNDNDEKIDSAIFVLRLGGETAIEEARQYWKNQGR